MKCSDLSLFFVLLASSLLANGQVVTGEVLDVGTRQRMGNADILSSPNEKLAKSSLNGDFILDLNPLLESQVEAELVLSKHSRTVFWKSKGEIDLRLLTLGGSVLYEFKGNGNSVLLPSQEIGHYILSYKSNDESIARRLFYDGEYFKDVTKNSIKLTQEDTSIVVSKLGYFSRKFEIPLVKAELNVLRLAYDEVHYFNELIRYEGYQMLKGVLKGRGSDVETVKALYDLNEDRMYYFNTEKYKSHYEFSKSVLGFSHGFDSFYVAQFSDGLDRFAFLATITYYKNLDKYVFEVAPFNELSCDDIYLLYHRLINTSYLDKKLFFYPNNQKWISCNDIPLISSKEIEEGKNYQALNLSSNFGYLKRVDVEQLDDVSISPHDILILNGIPNDVPVVSGLITTEFQTPLSHINILSHNRKTPNMALKSAWDDSLIRSLDNELIYLEVNEDTFQMRVASLGEAETFWESRESTVFHQLDIDTKTEGMIDIDDDRSHSVHTIGGKASNFIKLSKMGTIPLPEGSFAIPFYYYVSAMHQNGLDDYISSMLTNEQFQSNSSTRRKMLDELKERIENIVLDPKLVFMVKEELNNFEIYSSFKFRSSTNAEDLPSFTGAGLYNSYAAKKDDAKKTVEQAIKKVWASLWNYRAYEEREYYNIDHLFVAMGILVHRSFPDEEANGVVITKNLYNLNEGMVINVQYEEHSVVNPESGVTHDQVIAYKQSFNGEEYTFEYISHSNVPELNEEAVMTKTELLQLVKLAKVIKDEFYYSDDNDCNCSYKEFAMDIEFKVDSKENNRKIYIKQARVYPL